MINLTCTYSGPFLIGTLLYREYTHFAKVLTGLAYSMFLISMIIIMCDSGEDVYMAGAF